MLKTSVWELRESLLRNGVLLFQDRHLVAVAKPNGVLAMSDRTDRPCMQTTLREHLKSSLGLESLPWLAPVHRLDIPCSGVLLFARTSKAARRLSKHFKRKKYGSSIFQKRYLAVVSGAPPEASGKMAHLLRKPADTSRPSRVHVSRRVVHPPEGVGGDAGSRPTGRSGSGLHNPWLLREGSVEQEAELLWRVVAQSDDRRRSLVEVDLLTGRRHQIRAQFAFEGLPVVGDAQYGSTYLGLQQRKRRRSGGKPSSSSSSWRVLEAAGAISLHASVLRVPHPISGCSITFTAPVPEVWRDAFGDGLCDIANTRVLEMADAPV
jgi:23S rRNA pseudouridine1911/1915/1917 synthase